MNVKVFSQDGKQVGTVEFSDAVFGGEVNTALLHQVLAMYDANQRQGTSRAKTRSEVSGGGTKPWRQKGTGRARSGSNTSPVWVRGAKAHGPKPRSYWSRIPRAMRVLALRHALSARAREEGMVVVDGVNCEPAKTRTVAAMLKALPLSGARCLLVTDGSDQTMYRCGRNIRNVQVVPVSGLNAAMVLKSDTVVLCKKELVGKLEEAVTL